MVETRLAYGDACAPFIQAGWEPVWFRAAAPPGAALTEGSELDPKGLGKIPCRWNGVAWSGYNWRTPITPAQVAGMAAWPTGNVCVLAEHVQCIDCDVSDELLANLIRFELAAFLGLAVGALRYRGRSDSPRWAAPVWGLAGRHGPWQIETADGVKVGTIELLTTGKQWVVAGQHPKGGVYTWPGRVAALAQLPQLEEGAPEALRMALEAALGPVGYRLTQDARKASSEAPGGERRRVEDLPPLLSLASLERLLEAVPCDQDTVGGHDDAVKVLAAIAAVLGRGCWPDAPPCLEAWSQSYPGTTEGWFAQRWASLEYVSQGVDGFLKWLDRVGGELSAGITKEIRHAQAQEDFEDRLEDVEAARGERAREAVVDEGAEAAHAEALAEAKARYAYRNYADEWVSLTRMVFMTPRQFDACTMGLRLTETRLAVDMAQARRKGGKRPRPVPGSRLLQEAGAVRVDNITYVPGAERFIREEDGTLSLNKWTGPPKPFAGRVVTDEEVRPYLDVLEHVFPVQTVREQFLDYSAHITQFPGVKVEWAPVMMSSTPGTGKDTLLRVLRIGSVGVANWRVVQLQDLLGTNNAHWAEAHVLLVIELPQGRQRDAVGILKGLVASVAGGRLINPKHVAPYIIPDHVCWIATTNHVDALDLTEPDRRFNILHTQEVELPEALAKAVYAFYASEGDQGGLFLVAQWLRQRVISAAFNPKRCPVASEAKAAMRRHSLDGSPAGILLERLTVQDVAGSLEHRGALWQVEVDEVISAAKREARFHGKRGQVELAMAEGGFVLHPLARDDGRLVVNGPEVKGQKREQCVVKLWVRKDNLDMLAMDQRGALDALHADLKREGQHGLAEALGQHLAKVTEMPNAGSKVADLAASRKAKMHRQRPGDEAG